MHFFTTLTFLLVSATSVIAQLPSPGPHSPDPVTVVLTFKPKYGKSAELAAYFKHGEEVTRTQSGGVNIAAFGFQVSGKDEFVFVEKYTNQSAMLDWAAGPVHTELIKGFLPLVRILESKIVTDMRLF